MRRAGVGWNGGHVGWLPGSDLPGPTQHLYGPQLARPIPLPFIDNARASLAGLACSPLPPRINPVPVCVCGANRGYHISLHSLRWQATACTRTSAALRRRSSSSPRSTGPPQPFPRCDSSALLCLCRRDLIIANQFAVLPVSNLWPLIKANARCPPALLPLPQPPPSRLLRLTRHAQPVGGTWKPVCVGCSRGEGSGSCWMIPA